jgi:hypothetical protein
MTSQQSLRQQVRDQITEYSRLTQGLFTSFDILADGKTPPESPNDMMKQIVQLDNTLMGNVDKSKQKLTFSFLGKQSPKKECGA